MKHEITIRPEVRPGMRDAEVRITCTCGWVEKDLDLTRDGTAGHARGREHVARAGLTQPER